MKQLSWIVLLLTISTFSQTPGGGVTDIDGNRYNSVIIGTQEWMKENLNVSKYTDGTPIPQVTDASQWSNLTTGAWCYYNNDPANGAIYGKLYNWYAFAGIHDNDPNTPNKTLAPNGYRIPSNNEWNTFISYIGNPTIAGGFMKSTGNIQLNTGLWESPNTGAYGYSANNQSGFTGFPGGYRLSNGWQFSEISYRGCWWSLSENSTFAGGAFYFYLLHNYSDVITTYNPKTRGFSVRCLRDSSLSNSTFNSSSLKLYPNPVVSILNVKTDYNLINQPYTIIDGLGRVVLKGELNEVESTINVEHLSKGIYYLKVSGYSATKFIKE
jgi:uncharacterized protein (TIGR02145 family)